MDWNTILQLVEVIVVPATGAVLWYYQRLIDRANDRITEAERDLAKFRVHVAEKYLSAETFKTFENRLMQALQRVEDRLDRVMAK